jgi:hypothetical protein
MFFIDVDNVPMSCSSTITPVMNRVFAANARAQGHIIRSFIEQPQTPKHKAIREDNIAKYIQDIIMATGKLHMHCSWSVIFDLRRVQSRDQNWAHTKRIAASNAMTVKNG